VLAPTQPNMGTNRRLTAFVSPLRDNSWKSSFPSSNQLMVGDGLPGVKRIRNFWDVVDEVDLFVFPDIYDGDIQKYLRTQGKRVFGGAKGENLELLRYETKELFKKLGMPVQPIKNIVGLEALRAHLKDHENKYIKVSTTRGDFETFHHTTYKLTEPLLDELEHRLGAKKKVLEFVVEDAIEPAIENGYDGVCIDGQFAQKNSMYGFEIKDCGYALTIQRYTQMPKPVQFINEKLSPILKKYQYRGFFSTEVRIDKAKRDPYLIDVCARAGSPPNELYQEMVSNWGDIFWYGADGEVVEPEPIKRYGVEALIHSGWADKNWQAMYCPKETRKWMKLRNMTVIEGLTYVAPQQCSLPEIGAVIGIGDTLVDAIKHLCENACKIEGYDIDIKLDAIPKAIEEIKKSKEEYGYGFGDGPIPTEMQVSKAMDAK